ncbi:hypothetical protein [Haloplasma contractile]|nr:hypothetical protein [Haloplasma contractile]
MGFLIASIIQALIIIVTETIGISNLGAKFTIMQLLTHVLVGQIIGFILLFIMKKFKVEGKINIWIFAVISGVVTWFIILSINSTIGKVNPPWTQGFLTVFSSLTAFILFSVIVTFTIKRYTYLK